MVRVLALEDMCSGCSRVNVVSEGIRGRMLLIYVTDMNVCNYCIRGILGE